MQDERSKIEIAERMMVRPQGATMDEILAATGGSFQYNAKRRLEARGYSIRKVPEGSKARYFATPPRASALEATVTSKGQVTIPKEVRNRLGVRAGGKLRFALEDDNRVVMSARPSSIQDSFGILGKPPRSATLEQMDEAIRRTVVDKYLRAVGRKRR